MVIFNSYVSLPEGIAFQIPVTGHRWISLAAAAVADTLRFGRNYLGNWKTSVLVLSSSLPMVGKLVDNQPSSFGHALYKTHLAYLEATLSMYPLRGPNLWGMTRYD